MFADWRSAPVRERTRAILGLLEKLARAPNEVTSVDLAAARAVGVSDAAIEDALALSASFHIINRVFDAFGVWALDAAGFEAGTRMARVVYLLANVGRTRPQQGFERLRTRVVEGPGCLEQAVRQAAFEGGEVDEAIAGYVTKVIENAYKITDRDVGQLIEAGYSEDEIFELTVAAAVGTGVRRWRIGYEALLGER